MAIHSIRRLLNTQCSNSQRIANYRMFKRAAIICPIVIALKSFLYNVIFSALHFIKHEKTLADAIKFSGKANYCSIIFSVIKKCMTNNSHEWM